MKGCSIFFLLLLLLSGFFALRAQSSSASVKRHPHGVNHNLAREEDGARENLLASASPPLAPGFCKLPKDTGSSCRMDVPMFFYNSTSERCEAFVYGGCNGNANRFAFRWECEQACLVQDSCSLPPQTGPGRAKSLRFFYNSKHKRCERFIYGGHQGNRNNFAAQRDCLQACSGYEPPKNGECPVVPPGTAYPAKFYCTSDKTCPGNEKCCHTGRGRECVLPHTVHPGYCPQPEGFRICKESCANDTQCAPDEKCCVVGCHRKCTKAIPAMPGVCPAQTVLPSFATCPNKCEIDLWCPPGKKCCFAGCALQCVFPEPGSRQEQPRGQLPEQDWNPDQAARRKVKPGYCPLPRQVHHLTGCLMRNSCAHDQDCPRNEKCCFIRCAMGCRPPLEDFCKLPATRGDCKDDTNRFFYNSVTKQCETFAYGGCGGNGNNFATQAECLQTCSDAGICQLPPDQGTCSDFRRHYFYNPTSGACEEFSYGGCRGNANNFKEEEECLQLCAARDASGQ